jgi:hypothetical protein
MITFKGRGNKEKKRIMGVEAVVGVSPHWVST